MVKKTEKIKTKAEVKAKNSRKKTGFSVPLFNQRGEEGEPVSIKPESFPDKINPSLLAQAARVYQSALYQGTASTKTRGEVTGSTRKIYRQKGTGRARHGSIKAPIFVGGGIIFGPKPRDLRLNLPKKMQKKAFSQIVGKRIQEQKLRLVEGLSGIRKTKDMFNLFRKMKISDKHLLLVLNQNMEKTTWSARNITDVTIRSVSSVSFLDVVKNEHIVVAKEAFESLLNRLSKIN